MYPSDEVIADKAKSLGAKVSAFRSGAVVEANTRQINELVRWAIEWERTRVTAQAKPAQIDATTQAEQNFEEALIELAQDGLLNALALLTGCFVGFSIEVLRRQGHDPDGDIEIKGGDMRDITIHASKAKAGCSLLCKQEGK